MLTHLPSTRERASPVVERLRWGSQVAEVRHAQGWQYTQSRGQAGHLQGAARPPVCSPAAGVPVRRQQYPSQGQIRSGPCPVPCLHCDLYLWAQLASMNTCCLGIQGRALPSALRAWGHAKQAARGLPHLMPWSSPGTFPPATWCPYSLGLETRPTCPGR